MFTEGCRTCCFVTGASRSFGRAVAVELARALQDGGTNNSTVVLIARSKEELDETKQMITTLSPQVSGTVKPSPQSFLNQNLGLIGPVKN